MTAWCLMLRPKGVSAGIFSTGAVRLFHRILNQVKIPQNLIKPKILGIIVFTILDEPLQGLDGMNRKLVKSFIEQLVNNSNTQMLFVSHQDSDAPDCITHILEFIAQDGGYSYIQSAV